MMASTLALWKAAEGSSCLKRFALVQEGNLQGIATCLWACEYTWNRDFNDVDVDWTTGKTVDAIWKATGSLRVNMSYAV